MWLPSPTRGYQGLFSSQCSGGLSGAAFAKTDVKIHQLLWIASVVAFCKGKGILSSKHFTVWRCSEMKNRGTLLMCFCKIPQTTFSSALFPVHSRNWKEFTQEETTLLLSDSYQDSFLCKRNSPVAIINQIIISLSHLSACGWCCSKGEMVISQKWM